MGESGLVVDLRGVEKRYGRKVHALRGVDMQVHPGEVFGLLGPNGAGKSTLVKIMMTVVKATRATGQILGQPVGHKPTLARVGYLPEHARFPWYLTGRQAIDYLGALAKVDRATRKRRANELLDTVGMTSDANRRVRTYSKGMQQRIGLAQAMVNDPDLIVLDEPTDGVDPVGRRDIRQVIVQLREQGKTIFINSHMLGELEMICDRVAILVGGKVVSQGKIRDLTITDRYFAFKLPADCDGDQVAAALGVRWEATGPPPAPGGPSAQPPLTLRKARLADQTPVELRGDELRVSVENAAAAQPTLDALRRAGVVIEAMQPGRLSLEELFMKVVLSQNGGEPDSTKGGA